MRLAGTRQARLRLGVLKLSLLSVLAATGVACTTGQELIPLIVDLPGRTMSKLPFVIASAAVVAMADQSSRVPEISPAAMPAALALLGGAILVFRARLRK